MTTQTFSDKGVLACIHLYHVQLTGPPHSIRYRNVCRCKRDSRTLTAKQSLATEDNCFHARNSTDAK